MKVLFAILFILGQLNVSIYCQKITDQNNSSHTRLAIPDNDILNKSYTLIDSVVNDSTYIIGLGEPSHGDKTSFTFQMGMIYHLVEKLGFREILMECDQNIIDTVYNYFNSKKFNADSIIDFMHNVIPPNDVIYNTKETIKFFCWIRAYNSVNKNNPIVIKGVGFSNKSLQSIFYKYILPFDSLNAVKLKKRWRAKPTRKIDAWADIFHWFSENQKKLNLYMRPAAFDSLEYDIKYMKVVYSTYYRPRENARSTAKLSIRKKINKFGKGQAARDSTMASNVIKYLQNSNNKKVILWAHNMHIQAWRPYRLPVVKQMAPSMGYILKSYFGDKYLTIGEDFSNLATLVANPKYNNLSTSKEPLIIKDINTKKHSKASVNILRKKYGITSGIYTWQELKDLALDNYTFQNIYVQGVRFYITTIPDIVVIFKNLYPRTILKKP